MAFLLVYSTFADRESARSVATRLVEERLAACANLLPGVESVYRWKGAVETASEVGVVFKTTGEGYPALESRLRELHPYEVPEIVAVPLRHGFAPYLEWIAQSTGPAAEG